MGLILYAEQGGWIGEVALQPFEISPDVHAVHERVVHLDGERHPVLENLAKDDLRD